jgi:hypothetical protein
VVYEPGKKMNGTLAWEVGIDHSYLPLCPTMGDAPRVGCRAEAANFSGIFTGDPKTNGTNPKDWVSFPNVYAAYKGSHDRNGTMTVGYGFNTNWIGPEYGFGKTMGEYYAENGGNQVLVLKVRVLIYTNLHRYNMQGLNIKGRNFPLGLLGWHRNRN